MVAAGSSFRNVTYLIGFIIQMSLPLYSIVKMLPLTSGVLISATAPVVNCVDQHASSTIHSSTSNLDHKLRFHNDSASTVTSCWPCQQ